MFPAVCGDRTQILKPKHDVMMCSHATTLKLKTEPKEVSTYLWFTETYNANICSGDWVDRLTAFLC